MTRQIVSTHDARKGFIAARREPRLTLSFVVRSFAGSIPRAPDQGFRRSPGRRFRRSLQRVRRRGTFKLSPTRRLVSSRLSSRCLLFEKRITVRVFTHTVDPTMTTGTLLDSLASKSLIVSKMISIDRSSALVSAETNLDIIARVTSLLLFRSRSPKTPSTRFAPSSPSNSARISTPSPRTPSSSTSAPTLSTPSKS